MAISEELSPKKLRKLNKSQIDIWNGFIDATNGLNNSSGISSSRLAKILLLDPGNIQRRLNKFSILGLVEKDNSDFVFCPKNIFNIFPYIPLEYRINQETLKIERISSFIEESLKLIIEKKIEKMTTELFEVIDEEYKKKKNFNDLRYEWLDKPGKEIEDIEIEKGELEFPPIETIEFFSDIPNLEDKPLKEFDQIEIDKEE